MKKILKLILAMAMSASAVIAVPSQAQSRAPMPDLSVVWDSKFGPIYWIGGYYGSPDKTLTGTLSYDQTQMRWAFRGHWGRLDPQQGIRRGGAVDFLFLASGNSFTGTYVTASGAKASWTGNPQTSGAFSGGSGREGSISYNRNLAYMMRDNAAAKTAQAARDRQVDTTTRCDREMITYFERAGLSADSIRRFCRP